MVPEYPREWRFTWEAQSHHPILKLFLFTPNFNPSTSCNDLNVDLKFEKALVELTWKEKQQFPDPVSLVVPLPRVLVDLDSPVNVRALDDHIEVKIALLLPVNHPIVSSFISELNSDEQVGACISYDSFIEPLSMDSDFKALSAKGEVNFYCRKCNFKLTKHPTRCSVELPSVNWTDVADNWFGGCCCSFGGVSEKLVHEYVKSYRCAEGTFLLTAASVVLCKDDLVGFKSMEADQIKICDHGCSNAACQSDSHSVTHASCTNDNPALHDSSMLGLVHLQKEGDVENGESTELSVQTPSSTCPGLHTAKKDNCCAHGSESFLNDQATNGPLDLQADQKSFLNCYLGNAFVFRECSMSKDIEWIDFACPQCSSILGAYPCVGRSRPLDGGIRLLKCCISDLSDDLFRKYTIDRMFTHQLLESAKDELSFRTVIKDLETKCPMLQIVLLNPNSWCCSGYCSEDTSKHFVKINLHPVVKVLYSHSPGGTGSNLRMDLDWETKNQADEMYMLRRVIEELMKSIKGAKDALPPSFNSSQTQGFMLSHISR